MKIFLYKINSIPRLEDVVDRKLICSVSSLSESHELLTMVVPESDIDGFCKLAPKICCALRFDYENGQPTEYKYYYIESFNIIPKERVVELSLDVKEVK